MTRKRTRGIICAVFATLATASAGTSGAAPSHPVRNGVVAFWTGARIYAIDPKGTNLHVLVPAKTRNCAIPSGRTGYCLIWAFAWSPDGTRLAFLHGASLDGGGGKHASLDLSLFTIRADGRGERRIAGCGSPWPSCGEFSWSPDGSQLVVSRSDGLFVVSASERSVRRLTRSRIDGSPRWSPDGSMIAFRRGAPDAPGPSLYIIAASGSSSRRLMGTAGAWEGVWSPDSRSLVFLRAGTLLSVTADGSSRPEAVVGALFGSHPSYSPDGRMLAYGAQQLAHQGDDTRGNRSTYRPEIWTTRPRGGGRRSLYIGNEGFGEPLAPVWSPNGRRIAFADDAVYVVNADGSRRRKLSSLGQTSITIGVEVAWQPVA